MTGAGRFVIALLVMLGGLVAGTGGGFDGGPRQADAAGVLQWANVRIDGASADDFVGGWVAAAGDVNGDGRVDVIVSADGAGKNGREESGSAYVVFGQASPTGVDLAALGSRGFRIDGAAAADRTGPVAAAGDVNGDGRADVVVGAFEASNNGRKGSGSAYVVFGQASPARVDLAALGRRGFRIDGARAGDGAGGSVAGAGDVNGDRLADVLVGADAAGDRRAGSGAAYVVFGQTSPTRVDLAALGSRGFRIEGAASRDEAGRSVAAAGDVNGDRLADVLVGAPVADNDSGSAYVVFGQASPSDVDLADIAGRGFRIDGAATGDAAGNSVAAAGDVNGDGLADLLVAAVGASNNGREESGSTYVVFGQASPTRVDLAALGSRGFRIDGAAAHDLAGFSVASAGDVNGDRLADVLVGADDASNNRRKGSGSAYVVFGQDSPTRVDLAALGSRGFRIDGAAAHDLAGFSVAPAGDVNGDRLADVLVGAPGAGNNGREQSGSTYIVFGKASRTGIDLAASDATPSKLALGGAASQAVLRQNGVIVTASCSRACRLSASGTVTVSGTGAVIPLKSARTTLGRAGKATLRLTLSPAARKRLTRLWTPGRRGRATVTASAVDKASNRTTSRITIALQR